MSLFKDILRVVFPDICICCSSNLLFEESHVCTFCLKERFEDAGWAYKFILPETVAFRTALWEFNKGGELQDVLHAMKYDCLSGLGNDLGNALGQHINKFFKRSSLVNHTSWILVPVPLYPRRRRKRGYNQARVIAQGVQAVTGWPVADVDVVCRTIDTRTQTGLTRDERRENIRSAFQVSRREYFGHMIPVIVDDIFTTGATTFELAKTLVANGTCKPGIITVAEA